MKLVLNNFKIQAETIILKSKLFYQKQIMNKKKNAINAIMNGIVPSMNVNFALINSAIIA